MTTSLLATMRLRWDGSYHPIGAQTGGWPTQVLYFLYQPLKGCPILPRCWVGWETTNARPVLAFVFASSSREPSTGSSRPPRRSRSPQASTTTMLECSRPGPTTPWRRLTRAIQCFGCGLLQNPGKMCSKCEADIGNLKSPFAGFRFHDLRHQAITELAESKASDQTIMSIAGHVSQEDAPALLTRSHGCEAKRAEHALHETSAEERFGRRKEGLRHKQRHKLPQGDEGDAASC